MKYIFYVARSFQYFSNMDIAKELVLNLKQSKISHAGYGLQKECEALIHHILQNMVKSQLPELIPEIKKEEDSIHYREEGSKYILHTINEYKSFF